MSAVNLSAGSETFLGVVLILFLGIMAIFFYLFAREGKKALGDQQQRDDEKK